jgi:hypothetical protein
MLLLLLLQLLQPLLLLRQQHPETELITGLINPVLDEILMMVKYAAAAAARPN